MDRVGAGGDGSPDDGLDREQVDRVGPVGRRGDRDDSQALGRSPDSGGDLATVRDEQRSNRGRRGRQGLRLRVKRDNRAIRDIIYASIRAGFCDA